MKHALCSVIFVALIVFNAAAGIQSEQPSGSIKGRITVDGKAQPGVVVSLFMADDYYYDRRPLATAITDADGGYRLTAVPAGRYSISTHSPLFVNTQIDHNGMNGRYVSVDAGEAVEDVNFALVRGGVITGRVTDTEGRPVISQPVMLLKVDGDRVAPGFRTPDLQIMTTDDRGVYRIYGVLPGKYLVRVGNPANMNRALTGGRFSNYLQTFHPDAAEQSKAAAVEVTPGGEAAGIDIKAGLLKKTYVATGRMVDAETGRPVPNNRYGIGLGETGRPIMFGAYVTNEKGEFRIELGEPSRVTIYPSSDAENNSAGQPFSFDLTSERVTGLEIKLRRAQTLSGIVIAEGLTGPGAASRLSQLRISVRCVTADGFSQSNVYAKVQEDGSFTAGGIIPSRLFFNLNAPASTLPKPWLVRVERNGEDQGQGFDVAEGESISDVRLFVAYGSGVVRGQVKIEGRAVEETSFFTDFNLFVRLRHMKVARLFAGVPLDARGRFVIEGLLDGDYELMLSPSRNLNDDEAGRDLMSRLRATRQTVTVAVGAETTVTILLDLSEKK